MWHMRSALGEPRARDTRPRAAALKLHERGATSHVTSLLRHESSGDDDDGNIYSSCKHLQAIIVRVAHDNVTIAIDSKIRRVIELAVAAAFGADCSNMRAVTVPQHLNAIPVSHNNVPGVVKSDALRAMKLVVA